MLTQRNRHRRATGHVFIKQRDSGPQWYVKYRLPADGGKQLQVQRRLGPAWTKRGRPTDGSLSKADANALLTGILAAADAGTLPDQACDRGTFADAAEGWLRHAEHDRGVKASTVKEYRSAVNAHLLPEFGSLPLADVTSRAIEAWQDRLAKDGKLSRRTMNKLLTNLHGIMDRARRQHGIPNPVVDVERHPERYSGDLDFYGVEEVHQLVRHAASEQDGAIFLTAAFTGLRRGELVALRWRDVDFSAEAIRVRASVTHGTLTTPKSGKVRSVPMVPQVAAALGKLSRREHFTGPDDLVFPGPAGGYLDGSALRRRYMAAIRKAKLRTIRFHDLRHVFGSLAIDRASQVQVKEWMGHANLSTTERYLHFKRRTNEAKLLADAFSVGTPDDATDMEPVVDAAPAPS